MSEATNQPTLCADAVHVTPPPADLLAATDAALRRLNDAIDDHVPPLRSFAELLTRLIARPDEMIPATSLEALAYALHNHINDATDVMMAVSDALRPAVIAAREAQEAARKAAEDTPEAAEQRAATAEAMLARFAGVAADLRAEANARRAAATMAQEAA
jgi:hypothetical protein